MTEASLRVWATIAPLALLPAWACGVGDSENVFGNSGTETPGQGGAGASSSSSTSSDVGASGGTGGAPNGPGPGPSSSSSSDAASSSSSRASSSSSGMIEISVSCGGTACVIEGQEACCWDNFQLNGRPQGECVKGPPDNDDCETEYNPEAGTGAETRIECQIPSHCLPGTVCCGDRVIVDNTSAYYAGTSCQSVCDPPDRVLCDPLDVTNLCPPGTVCVESQLLPPGYFICSNP